LRKTRGGEGEPGARLGKGILSRENHKCKDPEAGWRLAGLGTTEEAVCAEQSKGGYAERLSVGRQRRVL
jgi:hypothetical protein